VPGQSRQRGFSLVELIAVTALLTILLVVALPRLVVPEAIQARVLAREIAADLRRAQRLAIARRADFVLEFAPLAPPYSAYTVRPAAGGPEPDFPKALEAGVTASGPQVFTFRPDGSVTAGGVISVTAGGSSATVQVTAVTGRVTVIGP
jgi:prepilin-type N-terminal cleavage/methylation domain-containing protein